MILTIAALITSFGLILIGNHLEGGHLDSLIQPTAALIVGGGTLGAVMLAYSQEQFMGCLKTLPRLFTKDPPKYDAVIEQVLELAQIARKEGILALDNKMKDIENPFLVNFLRKVIDGYDPDVLKELMEDNIGIEEEELNAQAKLLEDGGAFAPTVGILGAVLGLIHVMSNLSDPSKLGAGIAVAFVATIYGVGAANLVFIPMSKKMKVYYAADLNQKKIMCAGICGIQAGVNPRVIADQLYNVVGEFAPAEDAGGEAKAA